MTNNLISSRQVSLGTGKKVMTTEPVHVERRVGQRFNLHLPLSIRVSGSQHEGCAFTQDLSARGSFFYTDFPLAVGEAVELTLLMPSEITLGESMPVRCRGSVLRVVQPSVGTKLGVAVHFAGYEYLAEQSHTTADFNRIAALHPHCADEEPQVPSPGPRRLSIP